MQRPNNKDPFLRIALPLILGVVMGFSLVLMGFVLLALAILAASVDTNNTPAWVWLLLGIISEIVGIYLMRWSMRGTPEPGAFGP